MSIDHSAQVAAIEAAVEAYFGVEERGRQAVSLTEMDILTICARQHWEGRNIMLALATRVGHLLHWPKDSGWIDEAIRGWNLIPSNEGRIQRCKWFLGMIGAPARSNLDEMIARECGDHNSISETLHNVARAQGIRWSRPMSGHRWAATCSMDERIRTVKRTLGLEP